MTQALHFKFKEISLAIDASVEIDQIKELGDTSEIMNRFLKESLACETVFERWIFQGYLIVCSDRRRSRLWGVRRPRA